MSVLEDRQVTAVSTGVPGQRGGGVPRGADAIYLLVFNDPQAPVSGYGLGWTLLAWHGSDRCWSTALAAHGAAAHASGAEAKVAAERVLARHGAAVAGWHDGASAELPMFRADPHGRGGQTAGLNRGPSRG